MDPRIIDLYNDYIHGEMPRRSFLKRVAEIAGGAAAAAAILPLIESNDAWGQQVGVIASASRLSSPCDAS